MSYTWTQKSPTVAFTGLKSPETERSQSAPDLNEPCVLYVDNDGLDDLELPRSRGVSFGENSEIPLSGTSSSSSLRDSRDNVLHAVLEADRNMQEYMREHGETWTLTNGDAPVEGTPVEVQIMSDNNLSDDEPHGSKQDILAQSTPKHARSTSDIPDGSLYSNESVFERENGYDSDGTNNLPSRTIRDAREVTVIEEHTTLSKHVSVKRPQDVLDACKDAEVGEADDAASWNSNDTEPENLSESVETSDFGTQTPRHRSTQTPAEASTQTPKLYRRKLPKVPDSGDEGGLSEDGGMSLESYGDESQNSAHPHSGNTAGTQTKIKSLSKKGKMNYTWKSDYSSAGDSDPLKDDNIEEAATEETNPALMQTMMPSSVGSLKLSGRNKSPESNHVSPDRESNFTLRRTGNVPEEPNYVKDYRDLIESFDGTASGPFVPTEGKFEDNVFMDGCLPQNTVRSSSGSPHERIVYSRDNSPQYRDNINVPRLKLRDHTDETSGLTRNTNPDAFASHNGRFYQAGRPLHMAQTSPPEFYTAYTGGQQEVPPSDEDEVALPKVSRDFQSQTTRNHKTQTPGHVMTQTSVNGDLSYDSSLPASKADTRDVCMQTPNDNSTQTPIRVRFGANVNSSQLRCLNIGDNIVFDADESGSLAAWSMINTADLDDSRLRHFSTQTFGQMVDQAQANAETQTEGSDVVFQSVPNVQTSIFSSEPMLSSRLNVPPTSTDVVPGLPLELIQPSPRPNIHHNVKSDEELRDSSPEKGRPRQDSDLFDRPSRGRDKENRHKNRQSSHSRDRESVMTDRSSKKDILKFMLDQVRSLKKQYSPERSPERKSKHRSKSRDRKPRAHQRESDSAIDSMAEDTAAYANRRLELLYRQPRDERTKGWVSEGEVLQRGRRGRQTEGYYSDRPERYDSDRARGLRHRGGRDGSWDRGRPQSGYNRPDRPRYGSPSRQRRAITPPPPGDLRYDRGRRPYRELEPRRRVLPNAPVRHPPPPGHPSVRRLPPPPHLHTAPPPMMPPPQHPHPGNLVQPGIHPSAFQPIQNLPQPTVIPQPHVRIAAPKPEPQYIIVEQPQHDIIVREPEKRRARPQTTGSHRPTSGSHRTFDDSLKLATKAAKDMKHLTHKLQRQH